MLKSVISILLALSFVLIFAGCGGNAMDDAESGMKSAKDSLESGMDSVESNMDDNAFNSENGMNGNDDRTYTSEHSGSGNNTAMENNSGTEKITREKAKAIALENAKVNESEIYDYSIELDRDNGVSKYDISFETKSMEYEYDIDSQTGKIISSSKEEKD